MADNDNNNDDIDLEHPHNKRLQEFHAAQFHDVIKNEANKLEKLGQIPPNIEKEDLHAAGFNGLMKAYERHNEGHGEFLPYAKSRIKFTMKNFLTAGLGEHVDKPLQNKIREVKRAQATTTIKPDSEE